MSMRAGIRDAAGGERACVQCDVVVAARAREGGALYTTKYTYTHAHTQYVLCLRNAVVHTVYVLGWGEVTRSFTLDLLNCCKKGV